MKKIFMVLIVSLLLILPVNAAGFIKFDGVDGESKDKEHKGWIDILSYGAGADKPESGAAGASRRRGSVVLEDFTFAKKVDKTTPILSEPICKGEAFKEVVVELCKPATGGDQHCYLKYEMKNVYITSYQVGGSADEVPTEEFSLNYEEIKVTYVGQDDSGRPAEPVSSMCVA